MSMQVSAAAIRQRRGRQPLLRGVLNRPGFRAYFLAWERWHVHAGQVRPGHQGQGDPDRPRARRGYPSEYAAITTVAGRLGMSAETLRKWIRQAAVDEGQAPGVSSEAAKQIRELKRKVNELERTIEIVSAASFRAGARPVTPLICAFIDAHRDRFGVVPICCALAGQGVPIAPRTCWARRSRPRSPRAARDARHARTHWRSIRAGVTSSGPPPRYRAGPAGRRRGHPLSGRDCLRMPCSAPEADL